MSSLEQVLWSRGSALNRSTGKSHQWLHRDISSTPVISWGHIVKPFTFCWDCTSLTAALHLVLIFHNCSSFLSLAIITRFILLHIQFSQQKSLKKLLMVYVEELWVSFTTVLCLWSYFPILWLIKHPGHCLALWSILSALHTTVCHQLDITNEGSPTAGTSVRWRSWPLWQEIHQLSQSTFIWEIRALTCDTLLHSST